jgi:polyisoprenoid-binding protein YceI
MAGALFWDSLGCFLATYGRNFMPEKLTPSTMRFAVLCLLASAVFSPVSRAQVPVVKISTEDSVIKFAVKASVAINGTFDKWDATLAFASTDPTTGVLDIKIHADSVNTGSGMKDNKLKSKDFFNADQDPLITFLSKKIVQTGPNTFDVVGDFTIRGASKPQTLTLTVSGVGTGSGDIRGTMVFDRKDYGMNKGIPFVHIGDSVDVTVDLKGKRVSGPPLVPKQ